MIYTFHCSDCGCTWQKEMPMSEYEFPKWCEVCGNPHDGILKRVYDVVTINFKGGDFTKSLGEEE